MDVPRSAFRDERFIIHWDHCISILPRRCWGTEQWIKPFTKAWRRTEEHKYLVLRLTPRWYCDEHVVFEKLKGNLKW